MVWDCIVLTVLFMNGAILSSSRGDYVRLGGLLFSILMILKHAMFSLTFWQRSLILFERLLL